MEPFELTLSQVNFEEKDLGPEHSLHSFSNLVCYDSEFKGDAQEGDPIRAKLIKSRGELQVSAERTENSLLELMHGSDSKKQGKLVNKSTDDTKNRTQSVENSVTTNNQTLLTINEISKTEVELIPTEIEVELIPKNENNDLNSYKDEQMSDAKFEESAAIDHDDSDQIKTWKKDVLKSFEDLDLRSREISDGNVPPYLTVRPIQFESDISGGQTKSIYLPEDSFAFEPSSDSFKAFTDTVEALALQRSVIETGTVEAHLLQQAVVGGSSVTPASEEEVARAIAEAQRQYRLNKPHAAHSQQGEFEAAETFNNDPGLQSTTQSDTDSLASTSISGTTSEWTASDVAGSTTMQHNIEVGIEKQSESIFTVYADDSFGSIEETSAPADVHMSPMTSKGKGKKKKKKSTKGKEAASRENVQHGELIRMPADRITTIKEKSSWFSSQTHAEMKSPVDNHVNSEEKQANDAVVTSQESQNNSVVVSNHVECTESHVTKHDENTLSVNIRNIKEETVIVREKSGRVGSERESIAESSVENINSLNDDAVTAVVSENLPQVPPVEISTPLKSSHVIKTEGSVSKKEDSVNGKNNQNEEVGSAPSLTDAEMAMLSRSSSLNNSVEYFNTELDRVLKEKAKLEGQIEILEAEARSAIKERAELQAKVAALKQTLKSQESSNQGVVGDRDALAADLETLKSNRSRLEAVVVDAQRLLDDKDQEIQTLKEDLQIAQESHEKTVEQLNTSRNETVSKDSTVQALKNKVAELYVDFQTSNQNKILAENEAKLLSSELKTLGTAKEWYQEQLRLAQEAKTHLQNQITQMQGDTISQATSIERLRAENVRIKNQLTEAQQRMLAEKELLARTLETIEADMMEREAAFAQMQRERESMEAALQAGQEAAANGVSYSELQEELRKCQNDLRRKAAQVGVMEHEQAELVKRLTMAQESILERDQTIEAGDRKNVEVEVRNRETETLLKNKEQEILEITQMKDMMEVELLSLKEEKKTFDMALQTLKDDMGKVEKSFRQMKTELDTKREELEKVSAEKEDLRRELGLGKTVVEIKQQSPMDALVRQAAPELAADHFPSETKDVVPKESIGVQCEELYVPADTSKMEQESALLEQIQAQKMALEMEITALQKSNAALNVQLESERKVLEAEVASLEADLTAANSQEQVRSKEIEKLHQEIITTKERILEMEVKIKTLTEEKTKLETQVTVNSVDEEAIRKLTKENSALKSQLAELQQKSHREIAKQKAKALQLGIDLDAAMKDSKEQVSSLELQIAELHQQMAASEEAKLRAMNELETERHRFDLSLDEQKAHMQEELQQLKSERETIVEQKTAISMELVSIQKLIVIRDAELEESHQQVATLQAEMAALHTTLEQRKQRDEDTKRLALELEREKGRLAGVLQSHSALKDHTSSLEAALARRESSAVAFSSHINEELEAKEKEVLDLNDKIKTLEDSLEQEKSSSAEIKKQLLNEKAAHLKLRRQMETLVAEHSQLSSDLSQKSEELSKLTSELDASHSSELKYKMEKENMGAELTSSQRELERLQREVVERAAKDPLMNEQIKNLEWQVGQKASELEALQQKISLVEERHQMEVGNLQKSLQTVNADLSSIRDETAAVKREKLVLQAKVAELKNALKSSVKAMKSDHKANPKAGNIPSTFDMAAIERLLADTSPLTLQSKQDLPSFYRSSRPLSFLQATLSGLRGEIGSLQKQVDEHTEAVQSSSKAWQELEQHVKDLREVCRNSAEDRAASESISQNIEVETSGGILQKFFSSKTFTEHSKPAEKN